MPDTLGPVKVDSPDMLAQMAPINDIIGYPSVTIVEDDPLHGIFALTLAAKSTLHLTRSTRQRSRPKLPDQRRQSDEVLNSQPRPSSRHDDERVLGFCAGPASR